MANKEFKVTLSPLEIQDIIKENIHEKLVFSERYDLENEKHIIITVYSKYYMRIRNDMGLVIICENTTGKTLVKITSTSSGEGLDFGASKDFMKKVQEIISEYII